MYLSLVLPVALAIGISFLCSLCEAVLLSLTASQVEMLRKSGNSQGERLATMKSDIEEPITAILSLNTIVNTVGASFAGAASARLFGEAGMLWFSALFTIGILLFSEILPKSLGVNLAPRLAPAVARILVVIIMIMKPVVWFCRVLTMILPERKNDEGISAAELQTIASLSLQSGEIDPDQEKVISNILELRDKTVRQIMTPRPVTFTIDANLRVDEAMGMIKQISSYSRIPAYDGEPVDICGIIMRKDILQAAAEDKDRLQLSSLMQPVHFVPESAPLNRVLLEFFERHQHLFVVVDEYGSMTGVISLEDVIEEIVGREIIDESDKALDMRELARSRRLAAVARTKEGQS
ncbi:MAG: hemolysin family protein [Desulfobulbaceae bacterium]|jgi:CBS domain containing-hemolysin-like protein|nr:hemolysin family protein [Desulfobulbaceae bacterium]